ncbi:MAG TPA: tetratricopeptide repeat protein, partial [Acidobacteriota bacterium]|nr:tetratricopeptide repeat protein [Acidobacteriota bacterium]
MSMRRAPRFRVFLAAFVLVPLAAGLFPSKAQTPDLDGQWLDAYNRADYAAAEALSRRLLAARPHDTDVRYNFACVLARQGRVEDALDALDAAVESGYVDPGAIARDPDLVSLRDAPRFRTILAKPETRMEEACAAKRMTLREGAATPFKLEGPAGGPTAAGELTPSAEGLSLRLVVEGTTPRQGQRGWRAGDGLLVNVVRTAGGPSETTSERFAVSCGPPAARARRRASGSSPGVSTARAARRRRRWSMRTDAGRCGSAPSTRP